MSTTLTIRIDDVTRDRLERLSEATSRSKSYLVNNAIAEFLELNEWQIAETKKTIREADTPGAKFSGHEDVKTWLRSWGSRKEKALPR